MILLTGATGTLGSFVKNDKKLDFRFPEQFKKMKNHLIESENHSLIHLAGISSRRFIETNEEYAFRINVQSTIELFKAFAENQGKRFIFASTGHIYGTTKSDYFSLETDDPKPMSIYARQKIVTENLLLKEAEKYETELVILRIFSIFGIGMREHYLSGMIENSVKNQHIMPLITTCDDVRDFSSPTSVANYIEKFQNNWIPKTLIVNACSGTAKTVQEQVQFSFPEIPKENYLRGNSEVPRLVGDNKLIEYFLSET